MTTIPNGLQLLLGDYNFLFIQITLPNNQPVLQTDPTGIRKLDGSGNNILHPTWGSSDTPFTRFTFNAFIGKNSKRKLLPTFNINRDRCLFIRNKDSDNAFGGAASFQSTATRRLVQRFGAFSYAVTMS